MLLLVLLDQHVYGYLQTLFCNIFLSNSFKSTLRFKHWLRQKINVYNIQVYVRYTHKFSLPQTAPFYWGHIGARTRGELTAPGTTRRGVYLRHGVDTSALACTRPGREQGQLYFTVAGFSYFVNVIHIYQTYFYSFWSKTIFCHETLPYLLQSISFSVKYSNVCDHF